MKLFKLKAEIVKRFGRQALVVFNNLGEWKKADELEVEDKEGFISFLKEKGAIEVREGPVGDRPSADEVKREEKKSEEKEGEGEEPLIKPIEIEEEGLIKSVEEEGSSGEEAPPEEAPTEEGGEEAEEEVEGEMEEGKGEDGETGGELLEPENEKERDIYDKFGEEGLKIYRLIDGKRTIAEIAIEADTTIDRVIRVVKYLQEKKSVEIKKPQQAEGRFAPLAASLEEVEHTQVMDKEKALWVVDKVKKDFLLEAKVKLEMALKFGKEGRVLVENLKEGMDVVDIVRKLRIPLPVVEEVMKVLEEKEHFVERRYLSREDVRKKYGEDSYIIYKRYGKKGILFYELLGDELDLRDIKRLIGEEDNEKLVDMFLFIRQTLGIELPVDRETLLKKLSE